MNEFITLMELNSDSKFDNLRKSINEALEKEAHYIPEHYIPQNMDDGLQQILGCGKYAKETD